MPQHPMHYKTIPAGETFTFEAYDLKDHDGPLTIFCDGTQDRPVTVAGGPLTNGTLQIVGQHVNIEGLDVTNGTWGGLKINSLPDFGPSNTNNVTIRYCTFDNCGAGVWIENASGVLVRDNAVMNGRMIVNDTGNPDNDFGAIGVMCARGAADVLVMDNTFRNLVAPSYDYGTDGAGVEIYNAAGPITVRDNAMYNVITGLEIGGSGTELGHVTFGGNYVYLDPQHRDSPSARPYTIHGKGNFGVTIERVTIAGNTFYNFTQGAYNTAKDVTEETGTAKTEDTLTFARFLEVVEAPPPPLTSPITLTPGQSVLVQAAGDEYTDKERQVIASLREGDLLGAIRTILGN